MRAGVVAGHFTPHAAQVAFVTAYLPKVLSNHGELQWPDWEAAIWAQETVPAEATVIAVSVDGAMAPVKGPGRSAKRDLRGKHASGATGNKEVGFETVVVYDAEEEHLQTVRYRHGSSLK